MTYPKLVKTGITLIQESNPVLKTFGFLAALISFPYFPFKKELSSTLLFRSKIEELFLGIIDSTKGFSDIGGAEGSSLIVNSSTESSMKFFFEGKFESCSQGKRSDLSFGFLLLK